jgi:hypothetical protein
MVWAFLREIRRMEEWHNNISTSERSIMKKIILFPILLLCLIAAGLFVITAKAIDGINES